MRKGRYLRLKDIRLFYLIIIIICTTYVVKFNHEFFWMFIFGIFVFISFYFGFAKINFRSKGNFQLLCVNIIFLLITYKSRIFILNLLFVSLLIWILITPLIIRLRGYFIGLIVTLIFFSFTIPYYRSQIPLVFFIYYPFYLFGYNFEKFKIRKSIYNKIISVLGATISLLVLVLYLKSLNIKDYYGLIYIQSLYYRNDIFVYYPIIIVSFLILCFSALILLVNSIDITNLENKSSINWRAVSISVSTLIPMMHLVAVLHIKPYVRGSTFVIIILLFTILYRLLDRKIKYIKCENNEVFIGKELNVGSIYLRIAIVIFFVLSMVISVEYTLRGYNVRLTLNYVSSPSFAYNVIFVSIIYLFILSLAGFKLGSSITIAIHMFLILGNYIKLKFLNEPLYLWDIYLIKDAFMISRDYISPLVKIILLIIFIVSLILILLNLNRIMRALKPTPNIRFALIIALSLIFNFHLLNNYGLLNIDISKDWYDGIEEFLRNGTYVETYYYVRDIDKYLNKKPKDYCENKIKQIKAQIRGEEKVSNIKPNVVVILSETFWDITNLKDIHIDNQINRNLNKYRSGTIIAPSFGWETANVEFEVLTGFSNFYFSKDIVPYNVYFNRSMPSIVSTFRDNGYSTIAIHPNNAAMYNRNKVYRYLGFNEFKNLSWFNYNEDAKGNYVSDDKVISKIADALKEGGSPKFIFGVTMQNHDPYDSRTKNYKNREIEVQSSKLDDVELDIINNYAQGVYDADKALGRIINEVNKIKRPTLVYYFGDHLPRLGAPKGIFDIYEKLNFIDDIKKVESDQRLYETPYVKWSNFKKMNKTNTPISPNQLAIEILKDSEIRYPDYFNFLPQLREQYPYLNNYLIDKKEIINKDIINNYYLIQYDIMFGNRYLID